MEKGLTGGVVYAMYLGSDKHPAYIGSTSHLKIRKREHKFDLNHGKHRNKTLQALYDERKHPELRYEILEVVGPSENLRYFESYWMKRLNPTCNEYQAYTDDPRKRRIHIQEEPSDSFTWNNAPDRPDFQSVEDVHRYALEQRGEMLMRGY